MFPDLHVSLTITTTVVYHACLFPVLFLALLSAALLFRHFIYGFFLRNLSLLVCRPSCLLELLALLCLLLTLRWQVESEVLKGSLSLSRSVCLSVSLIKVSIYKSSTLPISTDHSFFALKLFRCSSFHPLSHI